MAERVLPLTPESAAAVVGCEPQDIRRLCAEGKLRHARITKRHIRILPEWLLKVPKKYFEPPPPPPAKAPRPAPAPKAFIADVVYFVEAPAADLIKIGCTGYMGSRLRGLRGASPVPLTLIGCVPGGINEERRLHEQFADLRKHGEWFDATPRLRRFITSALAKTGIVIPDVSY